MRRKRRRTLSICLSMQLICNIQRSSWLLRASRLRECSGRQRMSTKPPWNSTRKSMLRYEPSSSLQNVSLFLWRFEIVFFGFAFWIWLAIANGMDANLDMDRHRSGMQRIVESFSSSAKRRNKLNTGPAWQNQPKKNTSFAPTLTRSSNPPPSSPKTFLNFLTLLSVGRRRRTRRWCKRSIIRL